MGGETNFNGAHKPGRVRPVNLGSASSASAASGAPVRATSTAPYKYSTGSAASGASVGPIQAALAARKANGANSSTASGVNFKKLFGNLFKSASANRSDEAPELYETGARHTGPGMRPVGAVLRNSAARSTGAPTGAQKENARREKERVRSAFQKQYDTLHQEEARIQARLNELRRLRPLMEDGYSSTSKLNPETIALQNDAEKLSGTSIGLKSTLQTMEANAIRAINQELWDKGETQKSFYPKQNDRYVSANSAIASIPAVPLSSTLSQPLKVYKTNYSAPSHHYGGRRTKHHKSKRGHKKQRTTRRR